MQGSQRSLLGLAFVLGAAALAYRGVLGLELLGWDSYPTIAASRIQTARDLADTFREPLMDGRYPGGGFYRPFTNLSFALDHALWGLEPFGYQLTNLLALGAGIVAVFALARRLLGAGAGTWIATAVFALHPLELEWLPAAARRADMLATLFTVASLHAWLAGSGRRTAPVWTALCVVLAAASKEMGAVALPLLAGAAAILPDGASPRERVVAALRAAALPAAGVAILLVARIAALGGLGGHPESALAAGALRGLVLLPDYARSLLLPQPLFGSPALELGTGLALALGAAAGLALVTRRDVVRADAARGDAAGRADASAIGAARGAAPPPRRVLALLGLWLALLLALAGVSGVRAAWYGAPFLPPYALGLGILGDGALAAARAGRRLAASVAGAVALVLLATHLLYSGLLHDYPEWRTVSAQSRAFLERLRAAASNAATGTTVAVPGLPLGEGKPVGQVGIRSALGMSDYSVQAWAELALPSAPLRVVIGFPSQSAPPAPGVVTVEALPLPGPLFPDGPRP